MADLDIGQLIRTHNNGTTDPAEVTVGVLDSAGAIISPATEGGNLATIAAVDFAKESGGNLDTIAGDTTTLAAVDFAKESGGNLATIAGDTTAIAAIDFAKESGGNLATIAGDTTSLDTKMPAQGQALMAASVPVAIASNQTSIPVHITSGQIDNPVVQYLGEDKAYQAVSTNTYSPASIFTLNRVWAAGSGRIKVTVSVGTTASETPRWVGFNSSSNPNVDIPCSDYKVLSTESVKVEVENVENGKTQTVYSTIVGNL